MIKSCFLTFALGLAAVFCSAAAGQTPTPGAADYRDFTNTAGKVLRARLLSVDDEKNAILRLSSNGKDIPIPISSLSGPDQAFINAWDPEERIKNKPTLKRGNRPKPPPPADGLTFAKLLSDEGYTSVKMKQEGRAILVDVMIDGKPFRFAVDTGQTLTMMDSSVARQLALKLEFELAAYNLADGSVAKVMAADVDSIDIGDVKIEKISLGVGDLQRIGFGDVQGVFGSDILTYFEGLVDWSTLTLYLSIKESD